jgi:CO/xanthine dehydrogenase FAD-binding subunit
MFSANFDYHGLGSVDEAVALLARLGGDAKILAGGGRRALEAAAAVTPQG